MTNKTSWLSQSTAQSHTQSKSSHRPAKGEWLRLYTPTPRRHRGSILRWHRPLPLLLVACAIALPPAWGATYKWTDEQGRVHYGDSIPPGEIHRPHEKMDRQGLVDMKVDAAPDPAQRAEEHRRAPQLAVEQEETRRRAIHDQFLIETYRDTTQARTAYDAKLARLDTSITLATAVMEKLTARRTALGKSAAAREYDDGTTHKLQQEIGELDLQLTQQRKYIEARRMERVELEQTAAQDIARIEQLQAEQLEAARDQLP